MRTAVIAIVVILIVPAAYAQSWNLLDNPHFDTDILHWTEASEATITWDSSVDVFGDPSSGSLFMVQVSGDSDAAIVLADCVPVLPDTEYRFGGSFYVQGGQPGTPRLLVGIILYDGPGCTGSALTSPSTTNPVATDEWVMKERTSVTPLAAVSARFKINLFNTTTDVFEVHGDTMFVMDNTPLFANGFEIGHTGEWSSTVGL